MSNTSNKVHEVVELPIHGTGLTIKTSVGESETTITYSNELQISPAEMQAFCYLMVHIDVAAFNYTMAAVLSGYAAVGQGLGESHWMEICNMQIFAQSLSESD